MRLSKGCPTNMREQLRGPLITSSLVELRRIRGGIHRTVGLAQHGMRVAGGLHQLCTRSRFSTASATPRRRVTAFATLLLQMCRSPTLIADLWPWCCSRPEAGKTAELWPWMHWARGWHTSRDNFETATLESRVGNQGRWNGPWLAPWPCASPVVGLATA